MSHTLLARTDRATVLWTTPGPPEPPGDEDLNHRLETGAREGRVSADTKGAAAPDGAAVIGRRAADMRRTRIEKRSRPARTGHATDDRAAGGGTTDGMYSLADLLDP